MLGRPDQWFDPTAFVLQPQGTLGNSGRGIDLSGATTTTVGGSSPGARNIISGNAMQGVNLHNNATANMVQGNFIGTNVSGSTALGNGGGEQAGGNNPVPNYKSAWDANWTLNYGGFDSPDASSRRNYIPASFVPRQNPFYCALPYNDVTHGQFKPEAPLVIPWFRTAYTEPGHSVCKDRWLAIRKGNRVCYAQWEDCGPFRTDHFQYVFQNERPKPNLNHGAGLDVSPAVRDYLGLGPTDVTDWQFVEVRDIPPGPWRTYGDNNHFVIAKRQAEARLVQQTNGSSR